jgi:hypothetical protein
MGYVKIDTRIFDSSLWMDKQVRDIFMVALIAAMPFELLEATETIEPNSLEPTGFIVPPGWYGLARIAPDNLIHKALGDRFTLLDEDDEAEAMGALRVLVSPDRSSRSQDFEGRRLARINDGFLVLNFIKYRDKDHTAKARMQRFREKEKLVSPKVTRSRSRKPEPGVGIKPDGWYSGEAK